MVASSAQWGPIHNLRSYLVVYLLTKLATLSLLWRHRFLPGMNALIVAIVMGASTATALRVHTARPLTPGSA